MNPLDPSPHLPLRPLPETAIRILSQYQIPARLLAHLRLVHDVAVQLCTQLHTLHLLSPLDQEAVFFGAATHDIGKLAIRQELTGSGSEHELRGVELLLAHGVSPALARFAQTHAQWQTEPVELEDLLVALADTCWKGKRDTLLEERIARMLEQNVKRDPWEVWLQLDTVIEHIAADADTRLVWQAQFPVS